VGFYSWAFLVFLMKESKRRRRKQPGKLYSVFSIFICHKGVQEIEENNNPTIYTLMARKTKRSQRAYREWAPSHKEIEQNLNFIREKMAELL